MVYGAAGFDDEVFEKEVNFWDGDLKAGDGYILDAIDEKRDEDVNGIMNQFLVCGCMERGEDIEYLFRRSDKLGDVHISDNRIKGYLHLF